MPSKGPRLIWEVLFHEFIMEPEAVLKKARDRQMPVIIQDVGAAVQLIRANELWIAENRYGTQAIELNRELTPQDLRGELEAKRAAFVVQDDNHLYHGAIVSFDALEVIKKKNPKWASKWAWDRPTTSWGP